MKPRALALGAAAVVVALVMLFVVLRSDDAKDVRPAEVARITQADAGNVTLRRPPSHASGSATPPSEPSRAPVTDYMVGGVRIRGKRERSMR